MSLAKRMSYLEGGFRYLKKDYSYKDIRHIHWHQVEKTLRNGQKTYEGTLSIKFANGKTLPIKAEGQFNRTNRTENEAVHKVLQDVAEKLQAESFNARMDAYEAQFKARGYITWGPYQLKPNGDLFRHYAFCLNLSGAETRSMLYPFRLVCLPQPKSWLKRLLFSLLDVHETLDLTQDRDCFLYILRKHVGLYWPQEKLRLHHGKSADGTPEPNPEAKTETPKEAPQQEQAHTEQPKPPPPKPRLGADHYLAILNLKGKPAWPEVKTRYRQLAKQYHPDLLRGRGESPKTLATAEEKLKEINEAFAWLEDYYRLKPKN